MPKKQKRNIFNIIEQKVGIKDNTQTTNLLKIPPKDKGVNMPHIQVPTSDSIYQADLLILMEDKGYKYALVVCDTGSKAVDAEPMKKRDAESVKKAFIKIFKRKYLKMPTLMIQVDDGP